MMTIDKEQHMICDECETVAHCLKNGCVPKQGALVVPDVMTANEGEHPEYVQGWNDCRQLMLQTRNN
jgi:hypothetical protein